MLSSIKKSFARIPQKYYWITISLSLIGLMSTYGAAPQWTLLDYIEVVIAVVSLYGVYIFTHGKKTIPQSIWKWFFWIRIISWSAYVKYLFTPKEELIKLPILLKTTVILAPQDAALILFTTLPTIYALYVLKRKELKTKNLVP